jgi:hypothetical protein
VLDVSVRPLREHLHPLAALEHDEGDPEQHRDQERPLGRPGSSLYRFAATRSTPAEARSAAVLIAVSSKGRRG